MNKMDVALFQKMFIHTSKYIIEKEPYLTEIDSIIGDGDHGIGMKRGWTAVSKLLENHQYSKIDELCYAVSMELLKTMGGASGVIFGTMFLGGISNLPHKESATAAELSRYFADGEKAIELRGKAKPGDKTMLDALYPACEAMVKQSQASDSIEELFCEAYTASKKGAEESRLIQSNIGRSKNFKEKTLGLPDPGAVSASLIFEAFYLTVKENVTKGDKGC